jgi:ABC-type transport system involved in multi-copper enzyme maturation permease subunit
VSNHASSWTLIVRDAVQQARRGTVTIARTAFAAAMLGGIIVLGIAVAQAPGYDVAQLGMLGRAVFERFVQVQFWVTCAAAALLVAQGIVEEREADTLDLLAITKLRAGQILAGKIGSRLLLLGTLVAASTPAMALLLGWGGVGPQEIAAATVNTAVGAALTGLMAATLSMFFRSPVVPALLALAYAVVAFLQVPWLMGVLAAGEEGFHRMSPALAGMQGGVGLWLPAVTLLPAAVLIMQGAIPLFEIVISRDVGSAEAGFGSHSVALWPFERLNKVGILVTGLVLGSLFLVAPLAASGVPVLGELWTALAHVALAWGVLRLVLGGVVLRERVRAQRQRRRSSEPWNEEWDVPDPVGTPVWRNPVAWRECATFTFGGTSRAILIGYLGYLALWVLVATWIIEDPRRATALVMPFAFAHLAAAVFAGVLHASSSMVSERRRGTLPLLGVTPLPSWRILAGKL